MDNDFLRTLRLQELETAVSRLGELTDVQASPRLLEIGAGAGWQARELARRGFEVAAIDVPDGKFLDSRVWPVLLYDGRRIPFADAAFDVLFTSNVLEHIPALETFQHEMRRVLRPGGLAVHIVPTPSWRLWTNLTHYPYLLKAAFELAVGRAGASPGASPAGARAGLSRRSTASLLRSALFPTVHGETGNALTEAYYFSRARWRSLFCRTGWTVVDVVPNRLFYSGNTVAGTLLPFAARRAASRFLGSACSIFYLSRARATDGPDAGNPAI